LEIGKCIKTHDFYYTMQNKTHINMKYGYMVDIQYVTWERKQGTLYFFFFFQEYGDENYKFIKLLFFILNYFLFLPQV
jgi:hypothetical protein